MVVETGTEYSFTVDKNLKIVADCSAKFDNMCIVTFDSNGGTAVSPVAVESGQTISKPATSKNSHRFFGWYIAGTDVLCDFSAPVTGNLVLQARWIPTLPVDSWK